MAKLLVLGRRTVHPCHHKLTFCLLGDLPRVIVEIFHFANNHADSPQGICVLFAPWHTAIRRSVELRSGGRTNASVPTCDVELYGADPAENYLFSTRFSCC